MIPIPAGGRVTRLTADGAATNSVAMAAGTYTLDAATGALSFTPSAGFAGTPPAVRFRVTDAYGQSKDGTYAATVTAGPQAPVATACASRRTLSVIWKVPAGVKPRR